MIEFEENFYTNDFGFAQKNSSTHPLHRDRVAYIEQIEKDQKQKQLKIYEKEFKENRYIDDFGFAQKNLSFFDRLRALYPVEKYRPNFESLPESTSIPEYYDPYKNDF